MSDGEADNCDSGCELLDGDFPTAFYVIFSALARIVRAVLLVKARVCWILAMYLLFFKPIYYVQFLFSTDKSRSQNYEKRRLASTCMFSVFPFVLLEQLGSHRTDFHDSVYYSIFLKTCQENQVSLKYGKNNGLFT